MILVYWLLIVNLAAFILYGADKAFAKSNARRIPERTLLFFAWIGGSIGAILGMRIFHHKTLKPKFAVTVPILMVLEIVIIVFSLYQNYHLTVSEYSVDLGLENDLTVVQISDLHNQFFGVNQTVLLKKIEDQHPDMIVITGDIVDKTHTSYGIALDFIEGAVKIAPVYYVTGNHEVWLEGDKLDGFFSEMEDLGVVFMDNSYLETDEYILAGVADSSLAFYENFSAYEPFDDSKPVIMLAHEPQFSALYGHLGADLTFTGHYHGGQIIIPGKGGLVSPEFEIFPKMYDGIHDINGMKLVISRGLGNSILPVRINNYPEIVVVKVQ
ncbi:MAG: DUF1294 domain-containing protein [Clostridiales bacterium]|nr:DUF1294 domain-containing protein [Clostridiales bacterium]